MDVEYNVVVYMKFVDVVYCYGLIKVVMYCVVVNIGVKNVIIEMKMNWIVIKMECLFSV